MTNSTPADPCVQAALHAAHFERWQRIYRRGPIVAPRRLQEFMPEPVANVPAMLELDGRGPNSRATVRALARSRSPLTARLVPKIDSILSDYDGQFEKCRCYAAAHAYAQAPHVPVHTVRAPGKTRVLHHESALSFDPQTWISTATERVIYQTNRESALEVIFRSFPQRWSRPDAGTADFFKVTRPVDPNDPDSSNILDAPVPKERGATWFMLEEAQWQWNRDFNGSTRVVLEIEMKDVVRESHSSGARLKSDPSALRDPTLPHLSPDDFEDRHDPVVRLHFKYKLRECLETRLLIGASNGGIGVDDGETFIEWLPDEKRTTGQLRVFAEKRVRFEGTPEVGAATAVLLNLLAPAMLSMIMQRLAFDAPSELIDPKYRMLAEKAA